MSKGQGNQILAEHSTGQKRAMTEAPRAPARAAIPALPADTACSEEHGGDAGGAARRLMLVLFTASSFNNVKALLLFNCSLHILSLTPREKNAASTDSRELSSIKLVQNFAFAQGQSYTHQDGECGLHRLK